MAAAKSKAVEKAKLGKRAKEEDKAEAYDRPKTGDKAKGHEKVGENRKAKGEGGGRGKKVLDRLRAKVGDMGQKQKQKAKDRKGRPPIKSKTRSRSLKPPPKQEPDFWGIGIPLLTGAPVFGFTLGYIGYQVMNAKIVAKKD